MRFYRVELRIWDTNKKIANVREFQRFTGAGLTESKEAIENCKRGDFFNFVEVIVSAERLGNYLAWRDTTDDTLYLGVELKGEYTPVKTPPIYE